MPFIRKGIWVRLVVGHLLDMRKLAESCPEDQNIGLNLLRFSNQAMQMLIKKQTGAPTQNIVVNYSYNEQGNALMQTMLPKEGQYNADPGGKAMWCQM